MVCVNPSITGKEAPRMRYSNHGWFREQFGFLKRQFLQEGDLPFTDILSEEAITPALEAIDVP
jgi:hypothetical protein